MHLGFHLRCRSKGLLSLFIWALLPFAQSVTSCHSASLERCYTAQWHQGHIAKRKEVHISPVKSSTVPKIDLKATNTSLPKAYIITEHIPPEAISLVFLDVLEETERGRSVKFHLNVRPAVTGSNLDVYLGTGKGGVTEWWNSTVEACMPEHTQAPDRTCYSYSPSSGEGTISIPPTGDTHTALKLDVPMSTEAEACVTLNVTLTPRHRGAPIQILSAANYQTSKGIALAPLVALGVWSEQEFRLCSMCCERASEDGPVAFSRGGGKWRRRLLAENISSPPPPFPPQAPVDEDEPVNNTFGLVAVGGMAVMGLVLIFAYIKSGRVGQKHSHQGQALLDGLAKDDPNYGKIHSRSANRAHGKSVSDWECKDVQTQTDPITYVDISVGDST